MSHPRVVEMRGRLWPLLELALKADDERKAEEILDEWGKGKLSYEEAMKKLRTLTEAKG